MEPAAVPVVIGLKAEQLKAGHQVRQSVADGRVGQVADRPFRRCDAARAWVYENVYITLREIILFPLFSIG